MTPENPGVWKLTCRTNSNLRGGMVAKYAVLEDCGKASSGQPMNGRKRWYYIAAVEQTWDYAPSGKDLIDGVNLTDSEWVVTWNTDEIPSGYNSWYNFGKYALPQQPILKLFFLRSALPRYRLFESILFFSTHSVLTSLWHPIRWWIRGGGFGVFI